MPMAIVVTPAKSSQPLAIYEAGESWAVSEQGHLSIKAKDEWVATHAAGTWTSVARGQLP